MTQDRDSDDQGNGGAEDGWQRKERKERVLHTRVSAVLEEELKRVAGSLRVPVSNVVRAMLEDAVEKIDEVGRFAEGEIRNVADQLQKHRDGLRNKGARSGAEAEDGSVDEAPAPGQSGDEDEGEPPSAEPSTPEAADEPEAEPREAAADDDGPSTAALDGVIGFQPLLLARAEQCGVCSQPLAAGKEAFVGVRDDGGPRVIVGRECLPFSQD